MRKKHSKKSFKKIISILLIILVLAGGIFAGYKYFNNRKSLKDMANLYFMGLDENQQIGKSQTDIEYNYNCSHAIEYPIIGQEYIDSQITEIVNTLKNKFINEYKDQTIQEGVEEVLQGITYFQYISYQTYLAPDNTMGLVFFETQESGDTNVISEKAYTYNFNIYTGKKIENNEIFQDGYKDKLSEYLKKHLTESSEYKDNLSYGYEDKISNKEENFNNYIITNDKIILYFDKYDILPGNYGIVNIEIPYNDIKDVMKLNTKEKTEVPESNTGVKKESESNYKEVNETVYAQTIVNVRAADNAQSEKKGTLNKGDEINRIGIADNGWSKVKYNNEDAYISSTYLTTQKPPEVQFSEVNETVYAIATVHVRSSYNTNSQILATLAVGDSVTRNGKGDNGWSKVIYNNAEAYIDSSYLSTTKPANETVEIQINSSRNIDPSKPMVALTFDDGPNPKATPRILETLQKYNAVATFFDLGTCMASYPKISQQEEAMGCEVGSHTYGHKNLNTLSAGQIQADMAKAEGIFESTLGHKPNLIRTPYGNANSTVRSTLKCPLINWDIDTLDWKSRNSSSILGEIRKYSNYDGRVILMHSIYTSTADAVATLVPELISKGYQLVTVPELAKYKGVSLKTGTIYYDFR